MCWLYSAGQPSSTTISGNTGLKKPAVSDYEHDMRMILEGPVWQISETLSSHR